MSTDVICPYCKADAELVTGREIYPHRSDLFRLKFWRCKPCGAYTGTHKDSKRHAPKGRLANAELRKARIEAHTSFDPLWKDGGIYNRKEAYRWLRDTLGMERQPHIGFMDVEQCMRVVELCSAITDEDNEDWTDNCEPDVRREVFECVAGDLPDGAYFAMAQEFGLEPEDLIDEEDGDHG